MIEEAIPTTLRVHAVSPPVDEFTTEANIPATGTRNGIMINVEYAPIAGNFSKNSDSRAYHAAR
jgi:hypothetical protein